LHAFAPSKVKKKMNSLRRILIGVFLVLIACGWTAPSARAQDEDSKSEQRPVYVTPPAWKSVEIGNFYFRRKRYAGALSRYKEAVKTDPDYAPGYLGLGRVYEKIGLKQKALEAYRKYLDELPSEKQAEEAKDVHKAIERLERELARPAAKSAKHR
jgi:tetratricopeptide (TPR) repeat protein